MPELCEMMNCGGEPTRAYSRLPRKLTIAQIETEKLICGLSPHIEEAVTMPRKFCLT